MNNRRAALWMIGAIFSFTSMAIAGRAISGQLDTFEIMFYRSIMGFLIVLAVAKTVGTLGEIDLKHFRLHLLRNIFHFTGQNLWFFALPLIPLAQLFALEFTSPIWVLLLAPIFLGEGLTLRKLAIAALGFIGVLIVAQPEIGAVNIGILAAGSAAIGFAGAAILTRKLTAQNSLTKILFFLTGLQILFGLLCAGYDGDIALPDLASRMQATTVSHIDDPDDRLLGAVMMKLFQDRQIAPPPALIAYLVSRIDRSFAAAARMVADLDAAALAQGREVNVPLARALLDNPPPSGG